jgi:hypothetical protein
MNKGTSCPECDFVKFGLPFSLELWRALLYDCQEKIHMIQGSKDF